MPKLTTYGPGGFDPGKPNGNIVAEVDVPDLMLPRTAADKIAAAVAALSDVDKPGKGNNAAELKAILKQLRDALADN